MQSIYCKHILQKKSSSTVVQCRLISTIIAIESTITIQYIKTTCLHIILILTLFASFSGKCANQTKMPTCGSWFWKLHHLHVFLVRPPRARSSSVPTKSLQSRRSATRLDASQVSFCFCVAFFEGGTKGKSNAAKKIGVFYQSLRGLPVYIVYLPFSSGNLCFFHQSQGVNFDRNIRDSI